MHWLTQPCGHQRVKLCDQIQRVKIIIKVYGTGSRDYGCEHV